MDYTNIFNECKKGSSFDLFRLKVAIEKELENPNRLRALKMKLRKGDSVSYFDPGKNKLVSGIITGIRKTKAEVESSEDHKTYTLPFYMLNLESADTDIHSSDQKLGLDRNQVKIGMMLGFINKEGVEVYGEVIKLNTKTATLKVLDGAQWRVSYSFLFFVVEGDKDIKTIDMTYCLEEK